jgi:4a-hydroxytetrahydrobiopterin dehydratase
MTDRIFSRQFHGAKGAEAWRVLPDGAYAFFRTDSFSTSARFVDAISRLVREGDEPHIDLRGDGVTVLIRAFKGRDYGLVQRDLDLARAISTTAREIGLTAAPAAIQSLSIIPGATDRGGIMPFWQGVLGYDRRPDSPDEDLIDPHGRLAPLWFEQMDELRTDGAGTIHLVVWVPWDEAESRVAAGLAAGSSVTTSRRSSGHSPIRPATRWTSRRRRRRTRPSELTALASTGAFAIVRL